jgi:hypothetical protein
MNVSKLENIFTWTSSDSFGESAGCDKSLPIA